MDMKKALQVIAAVVVFGLWSAAAQAAEPKKMTPEQQAMMEKMTKLGSPSEGHKALSPFIGKWTSVVRYWMAPGGPAEESKGTNVNEWALGGRFVEQHYTGTMSNGQPFEGLGITGYDNIRGEYQSIWLDSMMTGIMYGTGSFDAAMKAVKVSGEFSCPMTGEKNRWFRFEWKVIDNDHHTYYSYAKTPDGKEFRNMEITFTRAK